MHSCCSIKRIYFQIDGRYIDEYRSIDEIRRMAYIKTRTTSSLKFLHVISNGLLTIVDFQNSGSTSTTLDLINSCFNELQTGDCQNSFEKLKRLSRSYTRYSPFVITPLSREEQMKQKFPYARYNYSSNTQYQECVALETEVLPQIEGYIVDFRHVEEILMNLTTSEIQESLVLVRRLMSYYDEVITIELIYHKYDKQLNKACNWMPEVLNNQNLVLSKYELKPEELIYDMKTSLDKIRNTYVTLHHNYAMFIQPDLEILGSYLDENMKKVELVENVKSAEQLWDFLFLLKEDLQTQIRGYSSMMTLTKERVSDGYRILLTVDFPVINKENVYELELVKTAAAINDSRMQEIVDNLKVDVIYYLPKLVRECYKRLITSMEEITGKLVKPVENLLEQLNKLRNDLEIYQTSTNMDTDFFM